MNHYFVSIVLVAVSSTLFHENLKVVVLSVWSGVGGRGCLISSM